MYSAQSSAARRTSRDICAATTSLGQARTREELVRLVESMGGKIVYGDGDSIFVVDNASEDKPRQ